MTGQIETSSNCSRYVLASGSVNRLEVALDRNGASPVLKDLDKYRNSRRKDKKRRYADILEVLEDFVNDPLSMTTRELNYLRDEIWELKHTTLRILFGQGACIDIREESRTNPRLVIPNNLKQADPSSTCGRATNAYAKQGTLAPRKVIDVAVGIMREDSKK